MPESVRLDLVTERACRCPAYGPLKGADGVGCAGSVRDYWLLVETVRAVVVELVSRAGLVVLPLSLSVVTYGVRQLSGERQGSSVASLGNLLGDSELGRDAGSYGDMFPTQAMDFSHAQAEPSHQAGGGGYHRVCCLQSGF
jgi:hypothetical protein